ncbi:inositol monophosphatase family protein [Oryzihumus sp.]
MASSTVPELPELPEGLDLAALERLAVDTAHEAGRFIVDERPGGLGVAQTKSSATDVVTVMDQGCEKLLRALLGAARPDDAILGEEDGATDGTSGITWVVDPIDGTVNYLYEIPAYCVSVGAVVGDPTRPGHWRPVAGAVYNPVSGEMFHARLGAGAHLVDAAGQRSRLRAGEVDTLGQALVATGFGYRAEVRRAQAVVLAELIPHIRDIRRAGSAALDLCAVAAGRVDAYYERGLNPWDLAAGWLVATEAGALVSGLPGRPPAKELVVAAGAPLAAALGARLADLMTVAD